MPSPALATESSPSRPVRQHRHPSVASISSTAPKPTRSTVEIAKKAKRPATAENPNSATSLKAKSSTGMASIPSSSSSSSSSAGASHAPKSTSSSKTKRQSDTKTLLATKSVAPMTALPNPNPLATKPTPSISRTPRSSSSNKPAYSLSDLSNLSTKLFQPSFKPPRSLKIPKPPSLAASRLPPPCAELDERPRARVRRFKLWCEKVPALGRVVLDPKKRAQLKRFQTFAIPSTPQITRGTGRGRRDLAVDCPARQTIVPTSVGRATAASAPLASTPSTETIPPITTFRSRSAKQETAPPSPSADDPARRSPGFGSGSSKPRKVKAPVPIRKSPPSRSERKAIRTRLIQHQFILEREEERRFRLAMGTLMMEMIGFQRMNTYQEPSIGPIPLHPAFRSETETETDLAKIKSYTEISKQVRRSSKNVWKFVDPDGELKPLQGLEEAKRAVKKEEREREGRKKERRREREAKRNNENNEVATGTKSELAESKIESTPTHLIKSKGSTRSSSDGKGRHEENHSPPPSILVPRVSANSSKLMPRVGPQVSVKQPPTTPKTRHPKSDVPATESSSIDDFKNGRPLSITEILGPSYFLTASGASIFNKRDSGRSTRKVEEGKPSGKLPHAGRKRDAKATAAVTSVDSPLTSASVDAHTEHGVHAPDIARKPRPESRMGTKASEAGSKKMSEEDPITHHSNEDRTGFLEHKQNRPPTDRKVYQTAQNRRIATRALGSGHKAPPDMSASLNDDEQHRRSHRRRTPGNPSEIKARGRFQKKHESEYEGEAAKRLEGTFHTHQTNNEKVDEAPRDSPVYGPSTPSVLSSEVVSQLTAILAQLELNHFGKKIKRDREDAPAEEKLDGDGDADAEVQVLRDVELAAHSGANSVVSKDEEVDVEVDVDGSITSSCADLAHEQHIPQRRTRNRTAAPARPRPRLPGSYPSSTDSDSLNASSSMSASVRPEAAKSSSYVTGDLNRDADTVFSFQNGSQRSAIRV